MFDAGLDRLEQYSALDRERLTNSILELYDFVLGSLLDAGMTQKQNVIVRYITRLLLHIPGATIHTLRELLEESRRPFFLYADEFHSFTTHAFAGMLSQLRKYGLGLVLAHQHITQLEPEVFESILGNIGTLIVFRVGAKEAPILSKQLGQLTSRPAYINACHLTELPNYQCFIKLMIKGAQSGVFSATTYKL